jgi:hypothetical protein
LQPESAIEKLHRLAALGLLALLMTGCEQRFIQSPLLFLPSPQTHTLMGIVRSPAGNPIADATVSFMTGQRATTNAVCDSRGVFRISGLDSGTVIVTISAPGFVAVTRTLVLTNDASLDVTLDPLYEGVSRVSTTVPRV